MEYVETILSVQMLSKLVPAIAAVEWQPTHRIANQISSAIKRDR